METQFHSLALLFDQLGLESTEQAIEAFIDKHKPLPSDLALHEAEFWNGSQASFLVQGIDQDADWAEIIDQLDTSLR